MKLISIIIAAAAIAATPQSYDDMSVFEQAVAEKRAADVRDSLDAELRKRPADHREIASYRQAGPEKEAFVPCGSEAFNKIAAYQASIDSIRDRVSSHKRGRELLALHFGDQRNFLDHLTKYHIVPETAVYEWAGNLKTIHVLEKLILNVLLENESGNMRGKIFAKIKAVDTKIVAMNSYLIYLNNRGNK